MAAEIRAATAADAALLVPLCAEHAAFEGVLRTEGVDFVERLAAALATRRIHAWIACADGAPVGYASATIDFGTLTAWPFVHLDCLYLREAARGRGVGAALLAAVRRFAAERGIAELQWQTPAWNDGAVRFYRREGAAEVDKKRFYCRAAPAVRPGP